MKNQLLAVIRSYIYKELLIQLKSVLFDLAKFLKRTSVIINLIFLVYVKDFYLLIKLELGLVVLRPS